MNILKLKIHYLMHKDRFNVLKYGHMCLNLCLIWMPVIPTVESFSHPLSNLVTSLCVICGPGGLFLLLYYLCPLLQDGFLKIFRFGKVFHVLFQSLPTVFHHLDTTETFKTPLDEIM